MAKTLVTGAAGFVGSHVVRELLAAGREVRALLRPAEDTRNLEGLDVERVQGDLRDREAMDRAVAECSRVYHLAAIYALWLPEPRLMYDVNVDGTRNVMWAAYKAGVERVVHTSSIAGVGVEPGDRPATEVNPGFPFGARDVGPTPTGQILIDVVTGRMPGYFDAGFNAVDVEDVARGQLLAEAKGRVGECYLLTNRNVTMRDFMALIGREAGVKPKLRKVPVTLGVGLGRLLDKRADRKGRPPRISGKALRYAAQSLYYDNTKARTELGWTVTPIEQSVRKALAWFREHDYLR
jgi:dihydroflavonol-4-reductase